MSSNPRPEAGAPLLAADTLRAKLRRPMTLRGKLVVGIVGLIVLLSAVIGIVTELVLSQYLVGQLDHRLLINFQPRNIIEGDDAALHRLPPPFAGCEATGSSARGYQPDGALFALLLNGTFVNGTIQASAMSCLQLTAQDAAGISGLTNADGIRTIAIPGRGNFRVVASPMDPQNGRVLITGASLEEVTKTQQRLAEVMAFVAGGVILLGGALVFVIVRRAVRPLERVADTARKVATLPLHKGEVDLGIRVPEADTDPRTEIGSVGAAINQMLGHVSGALTARQASEMRVRQFVADASHELRTPLAAIRGYAELARRGEYDQAAVSHALGRVESESSRMTTLVEDLLLLARLDSGRPLAREDVDLTMLAVDRVSDARVAGPDHRWKLDLPEEPVTVTGDGARLHQVLANLLANARTHTPPGTTVTTAIRRESCGVVVTVVDDGPGIAPDLQAEIFGRFVRGDTSRSRAAGSTGLGLAIVAAVISAHGGTVTVKSEPGRTCATVLLPDHHDAPVPAVPVGTQAAARISLLHIR